MPLYFIRSDITRMRVDAIVTSANERLCAGGGVDGMVHRAAGPRLLWECLRLRGCRTGSAVATRAWDLPSRWVIHAVGPVWRGGGHGEERLLASCCRKALQLAVQKKCASVALPLISTGAYGYPKREAMQVITQTAALFLDSHELDIYIVLFDRESVLVGEQLHHDIKRFIDENYVRAHTDPADMQRRAAFADAARREAPAPSGFAQNAPHCAQSAPAPDIFVPTPDIDLGIPVVGIAPVDFDIEPDFDLDIPDAEPALDFDIPAADIAPVSIDIAPDLDTPNAAPAPAAFDAEPGIYSDACDMASSGPALWDDRLPSLGDMVAMLDESFVQMLLRKIDEKGMKDSECYKRANIDRKHFSKMRSDIHYRPKKNTAIALAIALELPLEETNELLMKAGFALSHSSVADIIVEYFIRSGNYDIHALNKALFSFDQEPLGCA